MRQRGRKSSSAVAISETVEGSPTIVRRPAPSPDLTPEQGEVWTAVVEALPADWFAAENFPLLAQYCRHTVEARRVAQLIDAEVASEDFDIGAYEKLLQLQARETTALKAMAASMRLSQQSSRTDGSSATAKRNARVSRRPWEA